LGGDGVTNGTRPIVVRRAAKHAAIEIDYQPSG